MKKYIPEEMVKISRYQKFFPSLELSVQKDIYAKILGRRNLMKLGAMCCHADIINYGELPYTDFIRTKTLCQGGDFCDFRFVRHNTDAGDGWERTMQKLFLIGRRCFHRIILISEKIA